MRLGLITTFDLGESVGLGDEAFRHEELADAFDPFLVGYTNPLGRGVAVRCDESSELVATWRRAALRKIRDREIDTGWRVGTTSLSKEDLAAELTRIVAEHPVSAVELTVHAVGTVYVRVMFEPGVPVECSRGLLAAYEYAGYSDEVSVELLLAARERCAAALDDDGAGAGASATAAMARLSRRGSDELRQTLPDLSEVGLLEGFTRVAIGVDAGDDLLLDATCGALEVTTDEPIAFHYHGQLYFTWAACVVIARTIAEPSTAAEVEDTPAEQVLRILSGFQVAHVFAGTCGAYAALFADEVSRQVSEYVSSRAASRTPKELNQLRALALAVVSQTSYRSVVATGEDRSYFAAYEAHAEVAALHDRIRESCEVVFSVQSAESEARQSRRDDFLNMVVLALTSLTVLSVSVDSLNFVRDSGDLVPEDIGRVLLLGAELSLLVLLIPALWRLFSRESRG